MVSQTKDDATRLKGKARKQAKAAAASAFATKTKTTPDSPEYILPIKDVIVLAEIILKSTKPPVMMPVIVQRILYRAIQARKRCSARCDARVKNNPEVNDINEKLLNVLEDAYEALEPCFEKPSATTRSESTSTESNNRSGGAEFVSPVGLVYEDPDHVELNIMATDKLLAASKASKTNPVFEIEQDIEADAVFLVSCFFEDLQRVRAFLKETWDKAIRGEITRAAASLTTNVAIKLVHQAEENIMALNPQLVKEMSYLSMINVLDPKPNQAVPCMRPKLLPDDLIYMPIYTSLAKHKYSVRHGDKPAIPTVMDLSSFFDAWAALNQGYFGVCDWKAQITTGDRIADDLFVSQMLLSFELVVMFGLYLEQAAQVIRDAGLPREHFKKSSDPFEDELGKAFLSVAREKAVGVWVVFAVQIQVDIHNAFRTTKFNLYRDLLCRGAAAMKTLNVRWSTTAKALMITTPEEVERDWGNPETMKKLGYLSLRIEDVLKRNKFINLIDSYLPSPTANEPEPARIYGSRDPTFAYSNNPVYCDLEALKISISMEELGIELANRHGSFIAVAHLYNAAKQLGLLKDTKWLAMDKAIGALAKQLFNNGVPTNAKDILNNFFLRCVGVTPETFSRKYRGHKPDFEQLRRKNKHALDRSEISEMLSLHIDGKDSAEQIFHNISSELAKNSTQRASSMNGLGLLVHFRDYVSEHTRRIEADIFSLTRDSTELLTRIRKKMLSRLDLKQVIDGVGYCQVYPIWTIGVGLDIFNEAFADEFRGDGVVEKRQGRDPKEGILQDTHTKTNGLRVAVGVMRAFVLEVNQRPEIKPLVVPDDIKKHDRRARV